MTIVSKKFLKYIYNLQYIFFGTECTAQTHIFMFSRLQILHKGELFGNYQFYLY